MSIRTLTFAFLASVSLVVAGCGSSEAPKATENKSAAPAASKPADNAPKAKPAAGKKGANKVAENADVDPRERRTGGKKD